MTLLQSNLSAPMVGRGPMRSDQAARLRALVEVGEKPQTAASIRPPLPKLTIPVIAIASGKGGVGKTNIAVNLSIALASRGVRATLIDADLGVANADVLCGLNPSARLDTEAIKRSLDALAINAPGGFKLVPGGVGLSRLADLPGDQRQALVDRLAELQPGADVLLIDAPAGVGGLVMSVARAATLTVVVVTPEPTSIADAYALIKCMATEPGMHRPSRLLLAVNQAASVVQANQVAQRLDAVSQRFLQQPVAMLGWVPHDLAIPQAVMARRPLMLSEPRSPAAGSIAAISARLIERLSLPHTPPSRASWWTRMWFGPQAS